MKAAAAVSKSRRQFKREDITAHYLLPPARPASDLFLLLLLLVHHHYSYNDNRSSLEITVLSSVRFESFLPSYELLGGGGEKERRPIDAGARNGLLNSEASRPRSVVVPVRCVRPRPVCLSVCLLAAAVLPKAE
jgi:hypothetical protein